MQAITGVSFMSSTPTSELLAGISVVTFESRMADATVNLLEKYGADVISAPSMQEVPLDDHSEVFKFGELLFSTKRKPVDMMIYTTGVGTRMLIETLETRYNKSQIITALSPILTVTRGPKPRRVLKNYNIAVDLVAPEPNTWKQVLETIDQSPQTGNLNGQRVAIQEYGEPNKKLIRGLRDRGADVVQIPIYRWALPDDMESLTNGITAIINNQVDIAAFTSKTQTRHVMKAAEIEGVKDDFREALENVIIASVGPVCSSGLEEIGVKVNFEPGRPKLGVFIKELAEYVAENQEIPSRP